MKKLFAIALALMLCVGALSVCAFAAEDTITVYVKIDSDSAPYAWAWGDYGNAFTEAWPGVAMTQDGDWWKIEVPTGTNGFIVNDGGDPAVQTANIAIDGERDVWITCASFDDQAAVVSYDGGETSETPVIPEVSVDGPFYVAGSGALCGAEAEWDPDAEANKMEKGNGGVFSITYTDVAAGTYSLKVTDGSWNNSWGGNGENGNFDITVAEDGAEVTVLFNAETKNVDVQINGELVPETGDMGLAAVAVALVAASAGLVCTLTKKKEF